MDIDIDRLVEHAKQAAFNSYSPYSRFRVGAALLSDTGSITTGANVENRSYGLTNCAERIAFFSAISSGCKDFQAIAVFAHDSKNPVPPCGACRQVMSEFADQGFLIILVAKNGKMVKKTLGELLPCDALHELKNTIP